MKETFLFDNFHKINILSFLTNTHMLTNIIFLTIFDVNTLRFNTMHSFYSCELEELELGDVQYAHCSEEKYPRVCTMHSYMFCTTLHTPSTSHAPHTPPQHPCTPYNTPIHILPSNFSWNCWIVLDAMLVLFPCSIISSMTMNCLLLKCTTYWG